MRADDSNSGRDKISMFSPSRIIMRALDRTKRLDYLAGFLVAAWPIVLAYLIGAHCSVEYEGRQYVGYLDSPSYWSLTLLLPLLIAAFRFLMGRIVPVGSPWPPPACPPIVNLVQVEDARKAVYQELRQRILSKQNVLLAFVITLIMHLLDLPYLLAPYFGTEQVGEKTWLSYSWINMFEANPAISKTTNLALLASALLAQFGAAFMGILTIILVFRHNIFFVRNIFQRHRVTPYDVDGRYFQINPQDDDRCFGFKSANLAFNTQVQLLMVAGAAIFLSRYVFSVGDGDSSFPLPSQWLMAFSWLAALAIVALPGTIKILPRLRRHSAGTDMLLENYLREFFSDKAWPKKDDSGEDASVAAVAKLFRNNAFWPAGDNQAKQLFFFAFWIFSATLFPPPLNDLGTFTVILTLFTVIAFAAQYALFFAYKQLLRYVDDRLVDPEPEFDEHRQKPRKDLSDLSLFISYRREDTAEYARTLKEKLQGHFSKTIFIDTDILRGKYFRQEIEQALKLTDVVIVPIGKGFLTILDERSRQNSQDRANDLLRFEITTALRNNIKILPVLVNGASMPQPSELPEELEILSQINASDLRTDRQFENDLESLIDDIKSLGSKT